MGSITIKGTSYSDYVSGLGDLHTAGTYYLFEPLGMGPTESAPEYEEQRVTYPGVDGAGIKRYGFRGRIITCEMGFFYPTKTECETNKNTFHSNISGLASFSITVPGGTARTYCRLVSCTPMGWSQYGLNMVLKMRYVFQQIREA